MNIDGFLDMGGYAGFVWPSYGVAGLLLAAFALVGWRALKRHERRLAELEREQPRRR